MQTRMSPGGDMRVCFVCEGLQATPGGRGGGGGWARAHPPGGEAAGQAAALPQRRRPPAPRAQGSPGSLQGDDPGRRPIRIGIWQGKGVQGERGVCQLIQPGEIF